MSDKALVVYANKLGVDPQELQNALMATFFKGATKEQFTALLLVANQYGLNPFLRELYAFPSRQGIVPMVSIDGWLRIINEHPQYAGMHISYAPTTIKIGKSRECPEYIEVAILRKDRPGGETPIREYLDECYRDTPPWNQMTRRMLRHKAIKEAGRVTMGLHGLFDEDEANDVLMQEGKRIVKTADENYEVIDLELEPEGTPEPLATEEQVEKIKFLVETKQMGQDKPLTLETVMSNIKRQFNFEGNLEALPEVIAESVIAGLAKLEDRVQGSGDEVPETAPESN